MVRLLPHYDEPDLVFGNIGGNSLTVPASLWEGGALGPRRAPPGVWCGVVWCGVVWCGVVWCGVVWTTASK